MIAFGAPYWLLGLALVPAIWWLHRASGHGAALLVPSLALFRDAATPGQGSERTTSTDPAWRRRALAAALLALALAQPALERPALDVVVWLDDSPSMGTRESAGPDPALRRSPASASGGREGEATRLALAFEAVRAALRDRTTDRIEIRSLTDPARVYSLDAPASVATASEPRPPPPQSLRRDAAHWLVTDGTSATLAAWAREAPLERTILVGARTENSGITALAARTSLADPARLDVQVQVAHAGRGAARRELVVRAGDVEVLRRSLDLAPGASEIATLSAERMRGTITAVLQPADDLAIDDGAALPAESLRRLRVAVAAGCPAALRAAIAAHPEVEIAGAGGSLGSRGGRSSASRAVGPDFDVECGRDAAPHGRPALLVHEDGGTAGPGAESTTVVRDAAWSTAARSTIASTSLPRLLVAHGSTLREAGAADVEPLLVAASLVLVSRRTASGHALVDTTLALDDAASARAPEYPLVVGALLDLVAGEPLLGRTMRTSHDPASLAVAALPAAAAAPAQSPAAGHVRRDAIGPILALLAALAVLWDVASTARRTRRIAGVEALT